jgi:hypothetical protein
MDETRVERALREGPPFRTRYMPHSLPIGPAAEVQSAPWRWSWVLVAIVLTLALVAGGEALIGSGLIKLRVLNGNAATPSPTPEMSAPTPTPATSPGSNDTSAWIAAGGMVTPRSGGHTVTQLENGSVLVTGGAAGGKDADLESLASAELLNPATLAWSPTGDMTQGRWGHTATQLPNGLVLIAGGSDPDSRGRKFRTAELYDPATGRWTATGDMAQARTGHSATLLRDGRVLVVGGNGGGLFLDSAELYDPATRSWTAAGHMAHGRSGHTATLLPDGRVLVAGGVFGDDAGSCCAPLSSAEVFDPVSGSWTATGSFVELVGGAFATLLPDGRVLVAGDQDPAIGEQRAAGQRPSKLGDAPRGRP